MNKYSAIIYAYIVGAIIFLQRAISGAILSGHPVVAEAIGFLLSCGILIGLYARFIEIYRLRVRRQNINMRGIARPITIAFIADIQVGNHKKSAFLSRVVRKIIALGPDLVLIGGDMVSNQPSLVDESQFLEPLGQLAKACPTYYVLGNHEYGYGNVGQQMYEDVSAQVIQKMEQLRIPLLKNQCLALDIKDNHICIFGSDDLWSRPIYFDPLREWKTNQPLIFLTHNADTLMDWPKSMQKPDIVLAGHTHGGQVWLPLIGPLGNAVLRLGKKFYRGLRSYEHVPIFTTMGLGESDGPIRFLCVPEIALITLLPADSGI